MTFKKVRSRLAAAIGVVAVAGVLAACTPSTPADKNGGTKPVLTVGLPAGPASLDPSKDSATFTIIRSLTNEPLMHQEPNGNIAPALAASWKYIGVGNTHFELTLRKGARFSNGEAVNADAVKKWLDYFSKATGVFVSAMGPIESITTDGTDKVIINLKVGNPVIPSILSERFNWGFVSAPAAVAQPDKLSTDTYGAGPYELDPSQTIADQQYTLVPNKNYDKPSAQKWSKVVVKILPDPGALLNAAEAGQVDAAWGETSTAGAAKSAGLQVLSAGAGWAGLLLADHQGTVSAPLANVKVRQALNYALDRKAIAKVMGPSSNFTTTSQITSTDGFDPKYANYYPYDPAKAKQLLKEAGYAKGFDLSALTYTGNPYFDGAQLGQAMAKYLAAVGVNLKVTNAATVGEFVDKRRTNQYPTIEATLLPGVPMWVQYVLAMSPSGAQNPFKAHFPELEQLWLQGSSAKDSSKYWTALSAQTVKDADFLPVYEPKTFFYVGKKITGVQMTDATPGYPYASEWAPKQ